MEPEPEPEPEQGAISPVWYAVAVAGGATVIFWVFFLCATCQRYHEDRYADEYDGGGEGGDETERKRRRSSVRGSAGRCVLDPASSMPAPASAASPIAARADATRGFGDCRKGAQGEVFIWWMPSCGGCCDPPGASTGYTRWKRPARKSRCLQVLDFITGFCGLVRALDRTGLPP